MKIKLLSDLHTEFDTDNGKQFLDSIPSKNVDILIVAGDLSVGFEKRIKSNLKQLCDRFPHVIYVAGNHDQWKTSIKTLHEQMAKLDSEISNLHWLENKRIEIDGKFFIGCTLWFDVEKAGRNYNWPDYRYIHEGPEGIKECYIKSKKYLEENVQKNDTVITHHMPSIKCTHPRWKGSSLNCFFHAPMDHIIEKNKPAFWLNAHSHDACDMMINQTRVIRNPRGYPGEHLPGPIFFNKDLLIEI